MWIKKKAFFFSALQLRVAKTEGSSNLGAATSMAEGLEAIIQKLFGCTVWQVREGTGTRLLCLGTAMRMERVWRRM